MARTHWVARAVTAGLAALGMVVMSLVGAPAALAALGDQGQVTVDKQVNGADAATGLTPGSTIAYTIRLGCNDNPCIGTALHDAIPAQFAGFPITSVSASPVDTTAVTLTGCAVGSTVTASCELDATITQALGLLDGEPVVGLPAGQSALVRVVLTVPTDLTPQWAHQGEAVVNTATVTSTNAGTASDSATATVTVPTNVAVSTTKTWTPSSQQYDPGATSTVATSVGNTSNVPVTSLVLQDPSAAPDGATSLAADNPFTKVDLTGLCASSLPTGATAVQVDAYYRQGGVWSWVTGSPSATATLPAQVTDLSEVGGLRWTYTGTGASITAGGTAGQQCQQVTQRSTDRTTGTTLVGGYVAHDTTAASATAPGQPPATASGSASLTVGGLTVAVAAGKQVDPQRIVAGDDFTAALTGKNTSNGPLDSLTLTEPGAGSSSGWFGSGLVLDAVRPSTWPQGATAATLTFTGCTPAADPIPFRSGTASVDPPAGCTPTGFTATWTGSIVAGTTAGLSVAGTASADLIPPGTSATPFTDVVDVSGVNAAGTASDHAAATLQVYYPTIAVSLDKSTRPSTVSPGGTVLTTLTATTGSTTAPSVPPTRIVVEDTWDGTPGTFWDAFDASEVSFTAVPAGSTLHAYVNLGTPTAPSWVEVGVPAGSPVSFALPAGAIGVRFVFDDPSGFAQGTTVVPNLVSTARATLRSDGSATDPDPSDGQAVQYRNTATTTASGHLPGSDEQLTATDSATASTGIITYPPGGAGVLAKRWVAGDWSTDLTTLASQSGATARTAISWGVTTPGTGTVVLTDAPTTGPSGTLFDAFDLTAIRPIAFTTDPLLRWDQVTAVELYDGTSWVTVPAPGGSWMTAAGFAGYTLTAAQQASTTSVRVTIQENTSARAASQEPGRPAPGAGVAWSATGRPFGFVWTLRNVARTGGWVTASRTYTGDSTRGRVTNVVAQDTTLLAGGTTSARASDAVLLVDSPANVAASKSAGPSSLVVPPSGQADPSAYPTTAFTITARNTSPARASYLRVADPCDQTCTTTAGVSSPDVFAGRSYDPTTNPFEAFGLTGIGFTVPAGVPIDESVSTVALWHRAVDDTLSVTTVSMATARTLGAAALADVVGVAVTYQSTAPAVTGGLIPSGQNLVMTLSTQLRATVRSTGEAMSAGVLTSTTVRNQVSVQGFDPVLDPSGTPHAEPHGDVALTDAALGVHTTKQISPDTLLELHRTDPVAVTLTADQGASTASPTQVVITDDDAGFFADFALAGLGAVTLPAGADQVRVDLFAGGTWHDGPVGATATLPADITDLAGVVGVRLTFSRADGHVFSRTVPPAGWTATAVLDVALRGTVAFPATGTRLLDTVGAEASNPALSPADDTADAAIRLEPGTARLDVAKDTVDGVHQVEPGVSVPWVLTFTNSGDGFLPVATVTDDLGPSLRWDGEPVTYRSNATGGLPTTGVTVSQTDPETLTFTFPTGSRLRPAETYTITLGLVLQPGLGATDEATNEFTVDASDGYTFGSGTCLNTTNSRGTVQPAANRCGTTNVVGPLTGALLYVDKSVKGSLPGATNISDASLPCTGTDGYYHGVCVANTAVGGRDTWQLTAVNTGTDPYDSLVLVDPLPVIGDRLLATGAPRRSDFRPVLDGASLDVSVPGGASWSWEVTTDAAACVGTGSTSAWNTNPTCGGNHWVPAGSYGGSWSAVTAIRVTVTAAPGSPMVPGATVRVRFDTVNVPGATSDAVSVSVPVTTQRAWNQPGAVATLAGGGAIIQRAPSASGVQVTSGALAVTKTVSGSGAILAPPQFLFDLSCTVPTGSTPATAVVDMGASAVVSVPKDGTTTVTGLPLGATCTVQEQGDVGDFGEQGRDPEGPQTVVIAQAGSDPVPDAQHVTQDNTFQFSEDQLPVRFAKVLDTAATGPFGPFTFHLACTSLLGASSTADFSLPTSDGSWQWEAPTELIPAQATCTVTETDTDGASATRFSGDGVTDLGGGSASFTAGATALVTATNTIGSGGIEVVKQRTGVGASAYGAGPFVVTASCTWTHDGVAEPIALPDDGRLVLSAANGYRAGLSDLRAGAACRVVETDAAGATSVTYLPSDGQVTVPDAASGVAAVTLTVTNHFDTAPTEPPGLAATGAAGVGELALLALASLLVGRLLLVVRRRRRG